MEEEDQEDEYEDEDEEWKKVEKRDLWPSLNDPLSLP